MRDRRRDMTLLSGDSGIGAKSGKMGRSSLLH